MFLKPGWITGFAGFCGWFRASACTVDSTPPSPCTYSYHSHTSSPPLVLQPPDVSLTKTQTFPSIPSTTPLSPAPGLRVSFAPEPRPKPCSNAPSQRLPFAYPSNPGYQPDDPTPLTLPPLLLLLLPIQITHSGTPISPPFFPIQINPNPTFPNPPSPPTLSRPLSAPLEPESPPQVLHLPLPAFQPSGSLLPSLPRKHFPPSWLPSFPPSIPSIPLSLHPSIPPSLPSSPFSSLPLSLSPMRTSHRSRPLLNQFATPSPDPLDRLPPLRPSQPMA